MPSLKMTNEQSISEKAGVRVCQNSHKITKKSCPGIKNCLQRENSGPCSHELQCQDVFPIDMMSEQPSSSNESTDQHNVLSKPSFQFEQQLGLADSTTNEDYEYEDTCSSILESFIIEHCGILHDTDITNDAGSNNESAVLKMGSGGNNDARSLFEYETCSISDYCLSEMVFENLPFQEDNFGICPFQDDYCSVPNAFCTMTEQDIILPDLEDFFENNPCDSNSCQASLMVLENPSLHLAKDESGSNIKMSALSDLDQMETFDPQLFIRDFPELSDVIENFQSAESSKRVQRKKPVTLVLDLDETLIHSSFGHSDDADITYTIFYNLTEKTVHVKKRPHLHIFLEKVAEMFKVVIFTASQRFYAEQLLNRLDPEGKLISERAYRDSCVLLDGKYAKDLTVLGVDLAKVAIIDNTPEVFRLQVNNGIPIKSWYDDPSDSALLSLLPFLETLADAEDVRPLIAKKFGNKE